MMFTVIAAESACLAFAAVISRIYLSGGTCFVNNGKMQHRARANVVVVYNNLLVTLVTQKIVVDRPL